MEGCLFMQICQMFSDQMLGEGEDAKFVLGKESVEVLERIDNPVAV